MTAEWYNAFEGTQTPVVLRLKLRPYCVGHRLLLETVCPGFNDGELSVGTLTVAALICSMSYEEAKHTLGRWWLAPFCKVWGLSCRKLDLIDEATKFAEYEAAANWIPPLKFPEHGSKCESPIEIRKLAIAMSRFGMSLSESLNAPIGMLTALEYAELEDKGDAEFVDESVYAAIQRAQEMLKGN